MPATLILPQRSLGCSCQTGNMAALLNSLFFVFKISFLPNYRAKYYDYIVKWCRGVACNWCVSLDIGLTLALSSLNHVSANNGHSDCLRVLLQHTKDPAHLVDCRDETDK